MSGPGGDGAAPSRIAWAGPLKAGSAIGKVGVGVAEALAARGHAVELIATDHEWGPSAPRVESPLPTRHVSELDLAGLADGFDSVVVNVGDHFLNHAGVFPLLAAAPCLAVMHDFYLGNLFNGWLWAEGSRVGERERAMVATYGPRAAELARRYERGELPLDAQAAAAPMTEWVARRAAGCLAHAGFYVPRLLASCAGPVDVAGLPVASRGAPPLPPRGGRRPVALTVGVMNPNKCVDLAIEAIAASPALRDGLDYRLVGPIAPEERARLKALAAARGYRRLRIDGPVDEPELDAALADSDLVLCLRRPVLEGASASLVEALLAGRPTVVADAGCYGDVPDDAVVKVPADIPVPALTAALERLVADEDGRRARGERARAYAQEAHGLEPYLAVLEPLMRATARAAPVLRMTRNLGALMGELGLSPDDPAVARIATGLQPLFAPAPVDGAAGSSQGASAAGS